MEELCDPYLARDVCSRWTAHNIEGESFLDREILPEMFSNKILLRLMSHDSDTVYTNGYHSQLWVHRRVEDSPLFWTSLRDFTVVGDP